MITFTDEEYEAWGYRGEEEPSWHTKVFTSKQEAYAFAEAQSPRGFVEGPFIDDQLNAEYDVSYRA